MGWLGAILVLILSLAVWEWAAQTKRISPLYFPPPSIVAQAFGKMINSGELWTGTAATLSRVFIGFAFGGLAGLVLGLVMGWSHRVRALVDPIIASLHPVPKLALFPLIMIIFGVGESSRLIVVALAMFFPMLIDTMAGARHISPTHFEVAQSFRAGLWNVFTRVVLPGSLPMILSGTRLALNIGLLMAFTVELIGAKEGLGVMIWFAWQTMRTEELYPTLATIAILGVALNITLQFIARRFIPWQVERA